MKKYVMEVLVPSEDEAKRLCNRLASRGLGWMRMYEPGIGGSSWRVVGWEALE